jgi:ABC-type multidrug transport system fused ATPase/permease subunit
VPDFSVDVPSGVHAAAAAVASGGIPRADIAATAVEPISASGKQQFVPVQLKDLEREIEQKARGDDKKPRDDLGELKALDTCKADSSQADSNGKLVNAETRHLGAVPLSTYSTYFSIVRQPVFVGTMLAGFVVAELGNVIQDWWLAQMVDGPEGAGGGIGIAAYMAVYVAIAAGVGVLILVRCFAYAYFQVKTATAVHDASLAMVLRCPLGWFDITPIGRILNRFSEDVNSVDERLPMVFEMFMLTSCRGVGTVLLSVVPTPYFALALIPVGYLFGYFKEHFRRSSREAQRLRAVTASPIFSSLEESLCGLETVRAYEWQPWWARRFDDRLRTNSAWCYLKHALDQWLLQRLAILSGVLIGGCAFAIVLAKDKVDVGLAGMVLANTLTLCVEFRFGVRHFVELEAKLNSFQRLDEYSHTLPQERARLVQGVATELAPWPQTGALVLEDVRMRYRPGLPLALKGVSASIQTGEHVGIVGRTGSGKSSLMLVLFRLVELERDHGRVLLDGMDTSAVGLHQLRSAMAAVPQDPVLFTGSVRYNLAPAVEMAKERETATGGSKLRSKPGSPLEKSATAASNDAGVDDEQVWGALEHVHMGHKIRALGRALGINDGNGDSLARCGLDAMVQQGGENFSVGERQLLCLARAVLSRSKLLVLDEATAAVDLVTDALIQTTIRKVFAKVTTLTIAHRLCTIIDSDRVMVMDKGRLVEFDSPANLLQQEGGAFAALAKEAGVGKTRQLSGAEADRGSQIRTKKQ